MNKTMQQCARLWCRQLTAQATTAIKTTVQQAATTIVGHHTTTTHHNNNFCKNNIKQFIY